jgi:hypothetical protein
MTTERRKAPRRKVVSIAKEGSWGNFVYRHALSCGHTEDRKRASTSSKLACAWCLRAIDKGKEMQLLVEPPQQVQFSEDLANDETEINSIRAKLASRLSIPIDSIEMSVADVSGSLQIRYASILLNSDDIARILRT